MFTFEIYLPQTNKHYSLSFLLANDIVINFKNHIQIKIEIPNPSQEPQASFKTSFQDLKDMDVLCTFKMKIERQNLEHWCAKDQLPYLSKNQDTNPQSGTLGVLLSPK